MLDPDATSGFTIVSEMAAMRIERIDALAAQREVLTAPVDDRAALYAERVAAPLRPFFANFGPAADPAATARMLGVYGAPEHEAASGLAALDLLARADAQEANEEALRRAGSALRPLPLLGSGCDEANQ